MSPSHQRGILLLQQGRHELADREFRRALADEPDDAISHAYLSLCLARSDRHDEALVEADEAVRCAPDLAFCHYTRAVALQGKSSLKEARAAIGEAIQLDPEDADYRSILAALAMQRHDWKGALEAADEGLALDPEHANCLNFRAMALVNLGRKAEAARTLGSALADDPENALTHANQGWTLLHQGDHKQALVHFREALRIDPELEWARAGIVEALKARFLVYRVMLAFFLWIGRQSSVAQWVVILGIFFGQQILSWASKSAPALTPFITPILILSFAFVAMTWIASPLFNLTLKFNRFGRMALSREQNLQTNWIGACFFLAAAMLLAWLATGNGLFLLAALCFGFLLFPLAMTFRMASGRPRMLTAGYTATLALIAVAGMGLIFIDRNRSDSLFQIFFLGSMASTWFGSFFSRSRFTV